MSPFTIFNKYRLSALGKENRRKLYKTLLLFLQTIRNHQCQHQHEYLAYPLFICILLCSFFLLLFKNRFKYSWVKSRIGYDLFFFASTLQHHTNFEKPSSFLEENGSLEAGRFNSDLSTDNWSIDPNMNWNFTLMLVGYYKFFRMGYFKEQTFIFQIDV